MRGTAVNRAYCCVFDSNAYSSPLSNPAVTGSVDNISVGALPAVMPAPASAPASAPATVPATAPASQYGNMSSLGWSNLTPEQIANIGTYSETIPGLQAQYDLSLIHISEPTRPY